MADQQPIKCMVIEDEPPARELLIRYIRQVPSLRLEAEAGNALQALSILQQTSIDLLFLDIHMPQISGIDFLKTMKHPPKVILTTAFAQYALEGYDLDVVDFLLKPVPFDRFLKAVNKAMDGRLPRQELAPVAKETSTESFVYFRADRKMVKVMLADLLYVESMKDYSKVFTTQGMLITKQSISAVEAMLPEKEFIRVHRSYIVSLQHVRSFTQELIEINDAEIPIGKLYRQIVMKALGS